METPWQKAKRVQHVEQEKKIAKGRGGSAQVNSGRLWFSRRDAKKFGFLIEARTTMAGSYSIKAQELKQLTRDAFFHKNLPAMIIEFEKEHEDWILIRSVDFEDLYERMLALEAQVESA